MSLKHRPPAHWRQISSGPIFLAGLLGAGLLVSPAPARSETIAIPQSEVGEAMMSQTLTFLWRAANPQATLILIPGGEGHIKLRADTQDLKRQFYQTLRRLTTTDQSSGKINVVIFDNPYDLPSMSNGYPSSRASEDHLSRIDRVVDYYKKKTGKPIWLLGHSNGAISISEYLRYKNKQNITTPVAGIIFSSSRNGTYINHKMKTRTMILHHHQDACTNSTTEASLALAA
ncbi:MAG: hypothetical protein EBY21_02330 [Alphaproteobacteria bacterium]|nr:hypothetical protein [Alphaproteobacteria bacterium]